MDKKSFGNLDPNLREAYERVMGTKVAPPSTPAASTPINPAPAHEKPKEEEKKEEVKEDAKKPSAPEANTAQNKVISYNAHLDGKKSGKKMSVPLLVGIGVVFLLLYTFLWAKIIGIKLPF